ncbi:MAG: hypothetical protein AAF907_06215, partial [Planctomycetota bacterium]
GLAGAVLPLPLIEPVVQVTLADVRADGDGLTAIFDLAVGAPSGRPAPTTPMRADAGVTLSQAKGACGPEELAVGVSTDLLRILSAELVAGGVPRIDARDVPGDPLARLHQRETLMKIVPGLRNPRFDKDELRARLTLAGPLSAAAANSDLNAMVLIESEDVEMTVDRRPPGGTWERAATLRFSLRQPVRARIKIDGAYRNFVAVAEGDEANIRAVAALPVVGDQVDVDLAAELLSEGWDLWLEEEGPFSGPLDDFELPGAALRIEAFASRAPAPGDQGGLLLAKFKVPDTTVENRSALPLTYRIQEPNGPWGGPFTLGPGETHTYKTRGTLRLQQIGPPAGAAISRTLEPGHCYHFHVPVGAVVPKLDRGDEFNPSVDAILLNQNDPRPWRLRAPIAGREFPSFSSLAPTGEQKTNRTPTTSARPRPAGRRPPRRAASTRLRSPGRN